MRALITWASTGFGAEFARQLATKWYDLILVARSTDKLKTLTEELSNKYSIKATYFTADLWTLEWIKKLCDEVIDKEDIDLLINNAWRWNLNWYLNSTFDDLQSMMILNMSTIVHQSQRIVNKWIKENKAWKIINVASIASYLFDWTFAMYSATKAFARSISYWIDSAIEDAGANIKIQCLCPWLSKTNFMWDEFTQEQLTSFWFMEASDVVKESIDALETWEFIVIPWEHNKEIVKKYLIEDPFMIRKGSKELVKQTWLHF
jgi:short-subunit dehydrogenase